MGWEYLGRKIWIEFFREVWDEDISILSTVRQSSCCGHPVLTYVLQSPKSVVKRMNYACTQRERESLSGTPTILNTSHQSWHHEHVGSTVKGLGVKGGQHIPGLGFAIGNRPYGKLHFCTDKPGFMIWGFKKHLVNRMDLLRRILQSRSRACLDQLAITRRLHGQLEESECSSCRKQRSWTETVWALRLGWLWQSQEECRHVRVTSWRRCWCRSMPWTEVRWVEHRYLWTQET